MAATRSRAQGMSYGQQDVLPYAERKAEAAARFRATVQQAVAEVTAAAEAMLTADYSYAEVIEARAQRGRGERSERAGR